MCPAWKNKLTNALLAVFSVSQEVEGEQLRITRIYRSEEKLDYLVLFQKQSAATLVRCDGCHGICGS